MQIEPKKPTTLNSKDMFTGDVWLDPIMGPHQDDDRMTVAKVRFTPGAHTAWHSHERGQTLHVTEGVALMGTRDAGVIEVHPGQTVYTAPGEEHWHGATPEDYMEHLAMMELGDDPSAATTWLEHVADEDYHRP